MTKIDMKWPGYEMTWVRKAGVSKSNFPVAKLKLLVAKSKFGLIEENLPPIFYRCHWYIVLVMHQSFVVPAYGAGE